MIAKRDNCQTSGMLGVIGRLCLIVCLWQGPLPWLHRHDTNLIETTSTAAVNLRLHLESFHSNTEDELGWHFHWILPCWNHAFDKDCQADQPSRESVSADTIVSLPTGQNSLPGMISGGNFCEHVVHSIDLTECTLIRYRAITRPLVVPGNTSVLRC